jgi:GntR family transcriptional regulator
MTEKKLTLHLDFHSGLPIYTQIVNQIQSQLANKIIKPGDQLPTVRALAEELGVNFNTIARAYRILDELRIISTQQGRGTYITENLSPEVEERLRHESLEVLAQRFIKETSQLGFSEKEISRVVRDSLRSKKETRTKDTD